MLDGPRVKEAREALGWSQRGFARVVGMDPSTLCKIEHDRDFGITLALAERIAWCLRKPLCALLKEMQAHGHGTLSVVPRAN